jgi:hypothetical protein
MKFSNASSLILLIILVFIGLLLISYYDKSKIPDFLVTTFGVLIAFQLSTLSNRILENRKRKEGLKMVTSNLMDELENNYQKLSGEKPNEILITSAYESAKLNNRLDLIDYDTAFKLNQLYDKIIRINDDVTRLLNFIYSSAMSLNKADEMKRLLQQQINNERESAKDLSLHIIGLLTTKYGIPSKIQQKD